MRESHPQDMAVSRVPVPKPVFSINFQCTCPEYQNPEYNMSSIRFDKKEIKSLPKLIYSCNKNYTYIFCQDKENFIFYFIFHTRTQNDKYIQEAGEPQWTHRICKVIITNFST